jgi:hypothetical protein
MSSPPARKDRNFRHPSVLRGARRVNGLTKDRIAARHPSELRRRKTLASVRLFFYNDECLLLFEEVTKREGGEARINLVDGLSRVTFSRYIYPNMVGSFYASAHIFCANWKDLF